MKTLERPSRGARVDTDPRFSRRRRAVARSKRRRIAVRTLVIATVAVCAWAVLWSPLLRVREVRLVGARHVSVGDITRAAELSRSDNLLLLSTGRVADAVETLPWVKTAEVDRRLPGTVRVRVVERRAAVTLALGAARWTLDATGRVLESGERGGVLPVLAGAAVGELNPGARITTREVRDALRALRSMPPSLRAEVEAIFAPTIERISFAFRDGPLVRYGAAERLKDKHDVLTALLRRIAADGGAPPAYIDVRVPTSPAVSSTVPVGDAAHERT